MKPHTYIIFALIGALVAIFPNTHGDLQVVFKFLVSAGISFLFAGLLIYIYNLAANKKAEDAGILTKENVPVLGRALSVSVGAIILTSIMTWI